MSALGQVLRGLVIGLAIAAPVGPIGLLCIRRTLADGRALGLATGLGAATADAVYGVVAAFGVTAATDVLIGGERWLRLLGGAFLCYLGARTFGARPAERATAPAPGGLAGAWASTFALTLANPATILSFAAVFAGLGAGASDHAGASALVLGVFAGSALWWLVLSTGVGLLRARLRGALSWVNRLSGALLAAFGAAALLG